MAATDSHFTNVGRSLLSFRRDQIPHPVDTTTTNQDLELTSFQNQVAVLFHDLAVADDLLSITWIRKLLDSFLICQEEFRILLIPHRSILSHRLMADYFDRAIKTLDLLNAVRDGIDQIRQWGKHLDIVLAALDPSLPCFGHGHLRRARKALSDLAAQMLDTKDPAAGSLAQRHRSFGRGHGLMNHDLHHRRSLSWSVSRSWSASRHIQAIGANLTAPRAQEIAATKGLANSIYTMSSLLLFVSWALVAAIQDRGIQISLCIPRSFSWAGSVMGLYERIVEESKKRDRKRSIGLLKEIERMERCARRLMEIMEKNEGEGEVRREVGEMGKVREALKDEMDSLERQLREMFHRVVRSRTDSLAMA